MPFADYLWIDGIQPTAGLRAKTRWVEVDTDEPDARNFPALDFQGVPTHQGDEDGADLRLQPIRVIHDPLREGRHYLVLCEVIGADGYPHASNTRAALREVIDAGGRGHAPWLGFEQQYTLTRHGRPPGLDGEGPLPAPGSAYCSVGADRVFGRDVAERHALACERAGLALHGFNAEGMPGRWEFQLGPRGKRQDDPSALSIADQLWLARYLLIRIAEQAGIIVSFDTRPSRGDWNGAGLRTRLSTAAMRGEKGLRAIQSAVQRLQSRHVDHVLVYGDGLEARLDGALGQCPISEFSVGYGDRRASIHIPAGGKDAGPGYFEDRRPGANADPYRVAARLLATVLGVADAGTDAGTEATRWPPVRISAAA